LKGPKLPGGDWLTNLKTCDIKRNAVKFFMVTFVYSSTFPLLYDVAEWQKMGPIFEYSRKQSSDQESSQELFT
jgi:hypothetical protein